MLNNFKIKLNDFEQMLWKQSENLGFGKWVLIRLIRVTCLVVMKIPKERPMLRAAALTYTTTLSFLPMLAMIIGLLDFIDSSAKKEFIERSFSQIEAFVVAPPEKLKPVKKTEEPIEPEKRDNTERKENVEEASGTNVDADNPMSRRLNQAKDLMLTQIEKLNSGGKLSGVSLILFMFGALTLLANIERAFNDIWGIENLRPIKQRMMSYVFVLVLSPVVIFISLMILGMNQFDLNEVTWLNSSIASFLQSGFDVLLTYLVTSVFFVLLYLVMPNVQVSFPSAFAGGLVAGIFFESNKLIAAVLVGKFSDMSVAFGSVALIPILLIACMVAWLIVLLGAHVASAWGNVEGYRREFLSSRQTTGYDETIALRLMLKIAEHFKSDGSATDYENVGEEWALPNAKLRNLLEKLEVCGLVHHLGGKETSYVPGKELSQISVIDVLSAVRFGKDGWQPIPDGTDSLRINKLVKRIHDVEERNLKELSLETLLNERS